MDDHELITHYTIIIIVIYYFFQVSLSNISRYNAAVSAIVVQSSKDRGTGHSPKTGTKTCINKQANKRKPLQRQECATKFGQDIPHICCRRMDRHRPEKKRKNRLLAN